MRVALLGVTADGEDHGRLGTTETLWWTGCELDGRMKSEVEDESSQGHWVVPGPLS